MREIKFRAWDKESEIMFDNVQDEYCGIIDNERIYSNTSKNYFGEVLEDENFIVMQYTGLKDKNGKEIYEGDIIKYGYELDIIGEVKFSDGAFGVGGQSFDFWKYEYAHPTPYIIGNIYENPELIKQHDTKTKSKD